MLAVNWTAASAVAGFAAAFVALFIAVVSWNKEAKRHKEERKERRLAEELRTLDEAKRMVIMAMLVATNSPSPEILATVLNTLHYQIGTLSQDGSDALQAEAKKVPGGHTAEFLRILNEQVVKIEELERSRGQRPIAER